MDVFLIFIVCLEPCGGEGEVHYSGAFICLNTSVLSCMLSVLQLIFLCVSETRL